MQRQWQRSRPKSSSGEVLVCLLGVECLPCGLLFPWFFSQRSMLGRAGPSETCYQHLKNPIERKQNDGHHITIVNYKIFMRFMWRNLPILSFIMISLSLIGTQRKVKENGKHRGPDDIRFKIECEIDWLRHVMLGYHCCMSHTQIQPNMLWLVHGGVDGAGPA